MEVRVEGDKGIRENYQLLDKGLFMSFPIFFFLAVLGFEFKASSALGRCCATWATIPTLHMLFKWIMLGRYYNLASVGSLYNLLALKYQYL
jgi:hypothetical protein